MVAYETITVAPVGSSLGARVDGIDLAHGLDPGQIEELHRALLEHLVVFLPEQTVDDDTQIALARTFGEPHPHPVGAFLGDTSLMGECGHRRLQARRRFALPHRLHVPHRGPILEQFPGATHPVVTIHPETGRKALFVNQGYTQSVVGLTGAESDALLAFLFGHISSPRFVCRYRWAVGDVAIWDERATVHMGEGT